MNATVRAAEIGHEHGTRDAEAWFARGWNPAMVDQLLTNPKLRIGGRYGWPQPDLRTFVAENADWVTREDDGYCAAYRAAVEETIRARCGEVTP